MYKLQENGVKRLSDNVFIPNSLGNRDWREYQEWLDEGNTPEPQFTQEELEEIQRRAAINNKREELKQEIKDSPPPQSLPGLSQRVEKLEIVLGIKEPEII